MWRIIVNVLAVVGALLTIVTCTPLVTWWSTALAGPWNDPAGDVLIVPGGRTMGDGIIGDSSYWRSVYAVRVWRDNHFRELILTGDRPITEPMFRFLVAEGIPAAVIRIEDRSKSTRENALNTAQMIGPLQGPAVLLTSDYHMFRAYRTFRQAGLAVLPRPFPDGRKRAQLWMNRWSVFVDLCVETAKVVYYAARGWI
jgi:uncharacterized SAM-binding protein YcdF (DUF218 family)